jgi:amino acid adenylation domain-containing protein
VTDPRRRLLAALRSRGAPDRAALPDAPLVTSKVQRRFLWFDLRHPGTGVHNLAVAFRFPTRLEPERVRAGLVALLRGCDVLRTTFDAELQSSLAEAGSVELGVEDAGADPSGRLAELAAAPFAAGPRVRGHLLQGPRGSWLALVAHHAVMDGGSLPLVLAALARSWEGQPLGLSETTHAAAVRWLEERADPGDRTWWQERLREPPEAPFAAGAGGFEGGERGVELATTAGELAPALLAAFALTVAKFTGRRKLWFGVPASLRPASAQLEGVIGPLVNTVIVPVQLDAGLSFGELARQVSEELRESVARAGTPVEEQLAGCPPDTLQLLFSFRDGRASLALGEGVAVPLARRWAELPLALDVQRGPHGLLAALRHREDRVSSELAARMLRDLAHNWALSVQDLQHDVGELLLPSPADLEELQRLEAGPDLPEELPDLVIELLAAVERHPDRIAVRTLEREMSYRELGARVEALAGAIAARGGEGPVAVATRRTQELPIALWAVLRAGRAYLPLDVGAPPERTALILDEARPSAIVGDEVAQELAERRGLPWIPTSASAEGAPPPVLAPDPRAAAYVIFTSGSTGRPKGVVIERRNVAQFLAAMDSPLAGPPGIWLAVTSPSFDIAVLELLWTLTRGYTVALAPESDPTQRGARALRPTHLQCTPSLARILGRDPDFREAAAHLVCWVLGGERMTAALVQEIRSYTSCTLVNAYGPTETTVWSAVHRVQDAVDPVPIGRPLAGTRCRVRDAQRRPVPPGAPGYLWIGGRGVARGYLGRPELERERFELDPSGGRWYCTGDRARWRPDGALEYLGRDDDQVKIRGVRIELGEVEAVLGRLPGIQQIAVVARQDELHAHYVGSALGPGLAAAARAHLPAEMIPTRWVRAASLPLQPSGKVDRQRLPAPADTGEDALAERPRSPLEEEVAEAFTAALGRRIGRDRSLFDEGGHSLLAVEIAGTLRARAPGLPLDAVFRAPTIAELAGVLQTLERSPPGPGGIDEGRPSYGQEQLWLLERVSPGAYNHDVLLLVEGRLDWGALQQALDRVVARHEILRTGFVDHQGSPQLVVAPSARVRWTEGRAASEGELVRQAQAELARPLPLDEPPLLRAVRFELEGGSCALLLVVHHLVWDAASAAILARELGEELAGRPLPAGLVRYSSFAAKQRARFGGSGADAALAFFRRALPPVEPAELPFDRPASVRADAGCAPLRISADWGRRLRAFARAEGTTCFVVLLSVLQIWLARQTSRTDVRIAVPVANRADPEDRELVGYLVNTVVTRGELQDHPSLRELVRATRVHWREVLAHHELPFPRLVEALAPARRGAEAPLAQVMLVFQEEPHPVPALGGHPTRRLAVPPQLARFELTLALEPEGEGWVGSLCYPAARAEPGTGERWAEQLLWLLREALERPDSPYRELRLDPELRVELEVARPVPRLEQRIAEIAARFPEHEAVRDGERTLSYAELVTRARRIGAGLAARGAGDGRPVLVTEQGGIEFTLAFVGAWLAGAAASGLPADAPPEHRRQLEAVLRPAVIAGPGGTSLSELEQDSSPGALSADELCYVAFTSGSTGTPKGIEQPHRSFLPFLEWQAEALGLGEGSRVAVWSPLHYDAAYCELFGALVCGATAVFAPARHSPRATAAWADRAGIHWLQTVPSFLDAWLEAASDLELRDLAVVTVSGEALPVPLARRWWDRFSDRVRLVNLYGPSETVLATWHPVSRPGPDDVRIPIGRPIAGRSVQVVDPWGAPAPAGAAGEIVIQTPYAARGYRDLPEETARRFRDGQHFLTGDRGRLRADGTLEFLGRMDRMVKVRGHRVDLGEIEAIAAGLPGVRACAAGLRGDPPQLLLWVEGPAEGTPLRALLAERLPPERVPGRVIVLPALPRGATGKLDPSALPLPALEAGAPLREGREASIAAVWSAVLGRQEIGRDQNFFDIGGDSLALARVHDRLRTELGLELPLVDLFRFPTVAALAARAGEAPEPVPERRISAIEALRRRRLVTRGQGP